MEIKIKRKSAPRDKTHANQPRNFRGAAARKNNEFTSTDAMGKFYATSKDNND